MKIVSVNRNQTEHIGQVAFNLDEDLPPEVLRKLEYGNLTFSGESSILIVTLDMRDKDPIGPETVANINAKIEGIVAGFAEEAAKRERMLEHIAAKAGLPLA